MRFVPGILGILYRVLVIDPSLVSCTQDIFRNHGTTCQIEPIPTITHTLSQHVIRLGVTDQKRINPQLPKSDSEIFAARVMRR